MSANYTPTIHPSGAVNELRYWSPTHIPTVFDDSLSYPELLGRVISSLNEVITVSNNSSADVVLLRDAFVKLQDYVNTYFENVDWLHMTEVKLSELVQTPEFYAIMAPAIENVAPENINAWMDAHVTAVLNTVKATLPELIATDEFKDAVQPVIAAVAPDCIDDWLTAHPEATTTVTDGSVTTAKLSNELVQLGEVPGYEQEIVYDMTDKSTLIQCDLVDNVPVPSATGTKYLTGFIDVLDEEASYTGFKSKDTKTPVVRAYDDTKTYLGQNYILFNAKGGLLTEILAKLPDNTRYIVCELHEDYETYYISGNKKKTYAKLKVDSAESERAALTEATVQLSATTNGVWTERISCVPGTDYVFNNLTYHVAHVHFLNASGISLLTDDVYNANTNKVMTAPAGAAYISIQKNAGITEVTGMFVEEVVTMPAVRLVPENLTPEVYQAIRNGLGLSTDKAPGEIYYNCTDYGVVPSSDDNTDAMQNLVDTVSANGGGVIWMPVGTYRFDANNSRALSTNVQACVEMKSGVSILGESITGTTLSVYGDTPFGASLFASLSSNVTTGCSFQKFTVDMSAETMREYTHKGKAFYMSGIRDYVFRDLRLISTPSTSLGVDMLDNVVIDSVYIYQGGRNWTYGGPGGAGIGIGTGKWGNENYIIRNCICDSCGHFGIFLEDQGMFAVDDVLNYSKGQIICNNIVRNGRHFGIGVRGGKNIVVSGNNLYDNVGGLYADYGAENVMFNGNLVVGSSRAGFEFGDEATSFPCKNVVVAGNTFISNAIAVKQSYAPVGSRVENNILIGNTTDNG